MHNIDYDKINPTNYREMFQNATNFYDAWNNNCKWQQQKWREAINKEKDKMMQNVVWKFVNKNKIEKGRKCIKCKWVFDIKRDGTFRARLVACGYSQVPGIDFKEIFSPVINDVALRIIIICQIIFKHISVILDVEVAFLNVELEEIIYMQCPEVLECGDDEVLNEITR